MRTAIGPESQFLLLQQVAEVIYMDVQRAIRKVSANFVRVRSAAEDRSRVTAKHRSILRDYTGGIRGSELFPRCRQSEHNDSAPDLSRAHELLFSGPCAFDQNSPFVNREPRGQVETTSQSQLT